MLPAARLHAFCAVDDPGDFPDGVWSAMIGILEHMLRYPEAKDTADGIRRWWLSTEEQEFTHEQVRQALDCLTQRGWIVESSFGDDTRVYGISAAGLDEGAVQIERFRR